MTLGKLGDGDWTLWEPVSASQPPYLLGGLGESLLLTFFQGLPPFPAQKAASLCLLFVSLSLAPRTGFGLPVWRQGAVNRSGSGFMNGSHVITARHSNLKTLWLKCLVSSIKAKWALGIDAVTL